MPEASNSDILFRIFGAGFTVADLIAIGIALGVGVFSSRSSHISNVIKEFDARVSPHVHHALELISSSRAELTSLLKHTDESIQGNIESVKNNLFVSYLRPIEDLERKIDLELVSWSDATKEAITVNVPSLSESVEEQYLKFQDLSEQVFYRQNFQENLHRINVSLDECMSDLRAFHSAYRSKYSASIYGSFVYLLKLPFRKLRILK